MLIAKEQRAMSKSVRLLLVSTQATASGLC